MSLLRGTNNEIYYNSILNYYMDMNYFIIISCISINTSSGLYLQRTDVIFEISILPSTVFLIHRLKKRK